MYDYWHDVPYMIDSNNVPDSTAPNGFRQRYIGEIDCVIGSKTVSFITFDDDIDVVRNDIRNRINKALGIEPYCHTAGGGEIIDWGAADAVQRWLMERLG